MKGAEHGKSRRQGCSGDGRGIGNRRGDGQAFRCRGRERAFCDRDNERGQRVAAELEAVPGAKIAFAHADVGTEAACLGFVNGAVQKFGRLDILVNNAGIRKYEKVDEASAASWNEILSVNLMSYDWLASSARRKSTLPGLHHYCVQRGQVVQLLYVLSQQS